MSRLAHRDDDDDDDKFRFLVGRRRFCRVPRARQGESTSDSHDLIIFFTLSRKGDPGEREQARTSEEEKKASGSTTLLHPSSCLLPLLDLPFFLALLYSLGRLYTTCDKV